MGNIQLCSFEIVEHETFFFGGGGGGGVNNVTPDLQGLQASLDDRGEDGLTLAGAGEHVRNLVQQTRMIQSTAHSAARLQNITQTKRMMVSAWLAVHMADSKLEVCENNCR